MILRVAILEDDRHERDRISALLRGDPEFELAGVYASAAKFLENPPEKPAHVIVLDLELPGLSGLDFLSRFTRTVGGSKILVMTQHDDPVRFSRAIEEGAIGYLVKPVPSLHVLEAIRAAYRGEARISAAVAGLVRKRFKDTAPGFEIREALSDREDEILRKMASGLQDKEIAAVLGVSRRTVENHVFRILRKLHAQNRTHAVSKYLRG